MLNRVFILYQGEIGMWDSSPEIIGIYSSKKTAYREMLKRKNIDYDDWFERRHFSMFDKDDKDNRFYYEIEARGIIHES